MALLPSLSCTYTLAIENEMSRTTRFHWLKSQSRPCQLTTNRRGRRLRVESLEDRRMLAIMVDTPLDVVDTNDGVTSLREAITTANTNENGGDTITFAPSVFNGGMNSLIRLNGTELEITDTLTIDALSVGGVTITGDALGNDKLVDGTFITDIDESLANDANSLNDNTRVVNFSATSGDLTLRGLTVTGGRTTGGISGGGISTSSGNVTLTSSTVSGNQSNYSGGGIYTLSGNVTLTSSTVSGNEGSVGGGICTFLGNVTLTSSTVSGNQSDSQGGGVFTSTGDVTLTSSTVSRNSAENNGGGIHTYEGAITLANSTVTGNTAGGVGGGVYARNANSGSLLDLTIFSSIIAGNTDNGTAPDLPPFQPPDDFLPIINYSLIGNTTGSGIDSNTGTGNVLNVNPLLGPLAENGGPTQTHALLPGSPAIDAALLPPLAGSYLLNDSSLPMGLASEGGSLTGDGYQFGVDQGLTLNAAPISSPAYTIELFFSFDTLSGFQKILDVENLGSDSGLYTDGNVLNFFVAGVAEYTSTATLSTATPHHVVLTRNTSDDVKIYLDGAEVVSFNDSTGAANVSSVLRFFQDDTADGSGIEAGEGFVDFIRLYDGALSAAQVAALPRFDTDQRGEPRIADGGVDIGAFERQSVESTTLVVSTNTDIEDGNYQPGELSLREAISITNDNTGGNTITFAQSVFDGGMNSLIRLSGTELEITETLTIDASMATGVTVTGDVLGNDMLVDGTFITDVDESSANDANY